MVVSLNVVDVSPDETKVISELRDLFDHYCATFGDLAAGRRSDKEKLLDYYSAPLRYIGSGFHRVMKDDAALIGKEGIGGELDRLRLAGLAASTLEEFRVQVLEILTQL